MKMASKKHVILNSLGSVAFAALVCAPPAIAQDVSIASTGETAAKNSSIIIVTAQKREQKGTGGSY